MYIYIYIYIYSLINHLMIADPHSAPLRVPRRGQAAPYFSLHRSWDEQKQTCPVFPNADFASAFRASHRTRLYPSRRRAAPTHASCTAGGRCIRSVFKMSCLFLRPRLWQLEI